MSNANNHHIQNAKNIGVLLGIIISIIIFILIFYLYRSFYDPNKLYFISYSNHLFSYAVNKYSVNINIPSGYKLIDYKAKYNDYEYIIGKFKDGRIYAQVGILSNKNNLLAPGQDYINDLWRKKFIKYDFKDDNINYESLPSEEHILEDTDILFSTVEIYTDFSSNENGHMAIINILYECNFFPISILVVIHSDNQIFFKDCESIYQRWRACIMKNIFDFDKRYSIKINDEQVINDVSKNLDDIKN